MNIQNTFKQQRKLQNAFQKLIDGVEELPMDADAKTNMQNSLLEQFKSEAKKIVDTTGLSAVTDSVLPFEKEPVEGLEL